jgi:beta-glucosidase
LPGKQEQYVDELIQTGKPVILVMFGGRAQVISDLANRCAAVIQAWYPGEEGGNAVADILYGKVVPSAKLSVSYPNTEINEPVCYNYTAEKDPRIQWPFGYGLSYTTFEYKNLQVNSEAQTTDESVEVTFQIKNTGQVAADEIAQIYLSPTSASQQIRPIQLQGFARVALNPGETRTVTTRLYIEQLGFYSHQGERQWNIQPGTFTIKVGASSTDIRLQSQITLKGKPVNKLIRDYYFSESMVSARK